MTKRKFDKERSLEEGEVILTPIEDAEVVAWSEQGVVDEQVEAKVSTVTDELTTADIKWAKANLKGRPDTFNSASKELLERLCHNGVAADFGPEGFGRGHKFFTI